MWYWKKCFYRLLISILFFMTLCLSQRHISSYILHNIIITFALCVFNYFFMFEIILHIHFCSFTNNRRYAHKISAICLPKIEQNKDHNVCVFCQFLFTEHSLGRKTYVCTFITKHRQLQKPCLAWLAWVSSALSPAFKPGLYWTLAYCDGGTSGHDALSHPASCFRAVVFPQFLVRDMTASYYRTLSRNLLSLEWAFLTGKCGESWQTHDLSFV